MRFFALTLALLSSTLFASPITFSVVKNEYALSTYYEFVGYNTYYGRAIKSSIRVRTCYDLYDEEGESEGEGICRALSLGALFSWAREVDLYDERGEHIGMIDGKMLTLGRAKFNFYGINNQYVGVAYLDNNGTSFTLFDGSSKERAIGHLTMFDELEVKLFDDEAIDVRLVKLFAAFLADHWDEL